MCSVYPVSPKRLVTNYADGLLGPASPLVDMKQLSTFPSYPPMALLVTPVLTLVGASCAVPLALVPMTVLLRPSTPVASATALGRPLQWNRTVLCSIPRMWMAMLPRLAMIPPLVMKVPGKVILVLKLPPPVSLIRLGIDPPTAVMPGH